MNAKDNSLHINPIGENWEVESDSGTLGQAETKPEAIELARQLAREKDASHIDIHASDGHVEQRLPGAVDDHNARSKPVHRERLLDLRAQSTPAHSTRLDTESAGPVDEPAIEAPPNGAAPRPEAKNGN